MTLQSLPSGFTEVLLLSFNHGWWRSESLLTPVKSDSLSQHFWPSVHSFQQVLQRPLTSWPADFPPVTPQHPLTPTPHRPRWLTSSCGIPPQSTRRARSGLAAGMRASPAQSGRASRCHMRPVGKDPGGSRGPGGTLASPKGGRVTSRPLCDPPNQPGSFRSVSSAPAIVSYTLGAQYMHC